MNAKQTATLLGRIVEHGTSFHPLPTADAQWAIQNPKEFIALSVAAAKSRPKAEAVPTSGNGRTMNVLRLVSPTAPQPTATSPFSADQTFFNKKNTSGVKVTEHGSNFNAWFRGKTEEDGTPNPLTPYTLTTSAYDKSIIADLGGEEAAEVTLADIWALMEAQSTGKEGVLLTNGYANIFYVKDVNGVLRAVSVYWHSDGWRASASALDVDYWDDGDQVFSRNS